MFLLEIGIGTIVLTSIIVFLIVVLLLVSILLFARAKLTPQGEVIININDEKEIETNPGSTLLSTLSNEKIFIPSACGGGGTCAMCRVQVMEGGGTILPTEKPYFTRKEQMDNWRLGCQVKVREDMKIHVEPEVFGIKKWECEVVSNHNVATFIKELAMELEDKGYAWLEEPLDMYAWNDLAELRRLEAQVARHGDLDRRGRQIPGRQ